MKKQTNELFTGTLASAEDSKRDTRSLREMVAEWCYVASWRHLPSFQNQGAMCGTLHYPSTCGSSGRQIPDDLLSQVSFFYFN